MFSKTLTSNDFILDNTTGIWVATILASTHQLGAGATVCKMQKRDDNGDFHNTVQTFTVLSNGDVKIYVDEIGIYRVSIVDTKTRDI